MRVLDAVSANYRKDTLIIPLFLNHQQPTSLLYFLEIEKKLCPSSSNMVWMNEKVSSQAVETIKCKADETFVCHGQEWCKQSMQCKSCQIKIKTQGTNWHWQAVTHKPWATINNTNQNIAIQKMLRKNEQVELTDAQRENQSLGQSSIKLRSIRKSRLDLPFFFVLVRRMSALEGACRPLIDVEGF